MNTSCAKRWAARFGHDRKVHQRQGMMGADFCFSGLMTLDERGRDGGWLKRLSLKIARQFRQGGYRLSLEGVTVEVPSQKTFLDGYSPDGNPLRAGAGALCSRCHHSSACPDDEPAAALPPDRRRSVPPRAA